MMADRVEEIRRRTNDMTEAEGAFPIANRSDIRFLLSELDRAREERDEARRPTGDELNYIRRNLRTLDTPDMFDMLREHLGREVFLDKIQDLRVTGNGMEISYDSIIRFLWEQV